MIFINRKNLFLPFANFLLSMFIAFVWAFHINEKNHEYKEGKCHLCSCVMSPQLNCDCGTNLILKPEKIISTRESFSDKPIIKYFFIFSFSRAPPFFS